MDFRIVRNDPHREPSGSYQYRIYQGNVFVATYWHDWRGDENVITFANGDTDRWPNVPGPNFLTGGGPEPLRISDAAQEYLKRKIAPLYSVPGSEKTRAISDVICAANPLQFKFDDTESAHRSYAKYAAHIRVMTENGSLLADLADYLEKIALQRGVHLGREQADRLAGELLRAAA